MEKELFLSGYCRCMDSSRTVALFLVDGKLEECDCAYPGCPYAPQLSHCRKNRRSDAVSCSRPLPWAAFSFPLLGQIAVYGICIGAGAHKSNESDGASRAPPPTSACTNYRRPLKTTF